MILRVILALLGILFTLFGLDNGAGGLASLGVQVAPAELAPSNAAELLRDSHVRFLGGVFVAIGLAYIWGAARGPVAYGLLILLSGFVAAGGIFRLTGGLPSAAWPSLGAEVVLMPLLAVWMYRTPGVSAKL